MEVNDLEELLGYLIVIAIVVWLVYLVVVYIIAPISGVLGAIALSAGMLYALWISSSGFIRSMLLHKDPYTTYVDKHREAAAGVKRNYFFGPGYHQIAITTHARTKAILFPASRSGGRDSAGSTSDSGISRFGQISSISPPGSAHTCSAPSGRPFFR